MKGADSSRYLQKYRLNDAVNIRRLLAAERE
jgi:hypothetical protein